VDTACAVPTTAPLTPELLASTPHLATAQPLAVPPETLAVIELIGRGLAPDADDYTRATARELWARFCRHRRARVPDPPASPVPRDPPGGARTVLRLDGAAAARARAQVRGAN
jgi:hypothetical protein